MPSVAIVISSLLVVRMLENTNDDDTDEVGKGNMRPAIASGKMSVRDCWVEKRPSKSEVVRYYARLNLPDDI